MNSLSCKLSVLLFLSVMLVVACAHRPGLTPTPVEDGSGVGLVLEKVAGSLAYPTSITHAPDGAQRLFVTGQRGTIRVIDHDVLQPGNFLDISPQVRCCGEQGLLSMAFHPGFASNGLLFVYYTNVNGDAVIERFRVADDGTGVDVASGKIILKIAEPTPIHNGGQLQFGPDGYLYIGTGDGGSFNEGGDGSGDDPENQAQRLDTLLGKILRIDVDHGEPYAIPRTNPYIDTKGARAEIWASGLKNPWRFGFDRETGDLYIADVGRDNWEEIDFQRHDDAGGANYGWHDMEGPACFYVSHDCNPGGRLTLPVIQYSHEVGCAVIGGYPYRGRRMPALLGDYLYADFCTGKIWSASRGNDGSWSSRLLLDSDIMITAFGEDDDGELYVTDRDETDGAVYRLTVSGSTQ